MSAVTAVLNKLASKRSEIAEQEEVLQEQAGEVLTKIDILKAQAKTLENKAKTEGKRYAKNCRKTFVGKLLQLVWVTPKPVWNEGCIEAYCEGAGIDFDAMAKACKVGKDGYYSIRKAAKK